MNRVRSFQPAKGMFVALSVSANTLGDGIGSVVSTANAGEHDRVNAAQRAVSLGAFFLFMVPFRRSIVRGLQENCQLKKISCRIFLIFFCKNSKRVGNSFGGIGKVLDPRETNNERSSAVKVKSYQQSVGKGAFGIKEIPLHTTPKEIKPVRNCSGLFAREGGRRRVRERWLKRKVSASLRCGISSRARSRGLVTRGRRAGT